MATNILYMLSYFYMLLTPLRMRRDVPYVVAVRNAKVMASPELAIFSSDQLCGVCGVVWDNEELHITASISTTGKMPQEIWNV